MSVGACCGDGEEPSIDTRHSPSYKPSYPNPNPGDPLKLNERVCQCESRVKEEQMYLVCYVEKQQQHAGLGMFWCHFCQDFVSPEALRSSSLNFAASQRLALCMQHPARTELTNQRLIKKKKKKKHTPRTVAYGCIGWFISRCSGSSHNLEWRIRPPLLEDHWFRLSAPSLKIFFF